MPNSIDTRIVEMQFDNAKFERNINQSIKSLEKLDKSLEMKNANKGFEELEKAANNVDLTRIEKSLEFLEYRFTALGMTSAKIINSVTNKVAGLFRTINNNTIGQIKSGGMARALKLEHANFMLDGILKDAQKVKDVMDNAVSPAVDGTAYGLDAAANAASQFVAAGIQDIDKLKTALSAISGVAAMSGSDYEEIAHIFTKVASSGRMMGDTIMELSTRGINATAELSKYLGVTADEIKELQKKGQISFEDFSNAMYDAFAEQAKKANDTYTGALSNMKAALSRIGADFATPYLNNMRDVFNALRLSINEVRKALQPIVSIYVNAIEKLKDFTVNLLKNEKFISTYQNGIKILAETIRILSALVRPLGEGFKKAFPQGILGIISKATENLANFLSEIKINYRVVDAFSEILGGLFSILELGIHIIKIIYKGLEPILKLLNPILGTLISILGIIGSLITYFTDVIVHTKKFSTILTVLKNSLMLIVVLLAKLAIAVVQAVIAFKDLPIVKAIFEGIIFVVERLANFAIPLLTNAVKILVGAFATIIYVFKNGFFGKVFSGFVNKISEFFKSVKSGKGIVASFKRIFEGGFKDIPRTVHAANGAITELKDNLTDGTVKNHFIGFLTEVQDKVAGLFTYIGKAWDWLNKRISDFGLGRGLLVAYSGGLIALLIQGARLAGSFKKAMDGVPGVLKALKKSLKQPLFESKAKLLIAGLAVSLLSLAGALFIMSKIPADRLADVTVALASLIAVVGLVAAIGGIASTLAGVKDLKSFGIGMAAFAASVGILAYALKTLADIDMNFNELLKRVGLLGLIMLELSSMMLMMSWLGGKVKILFGSTFFLAFALSISMLCKSLALIAAMPAEDAIRGTQLLVDVIKALAVVALYSTLLNPLSAIGFVGVVAGILAFIAGINLMAKYMDPKAFKMVSDFFIEIYERMKTWLILLAIVALARHIRKAIQGVADIIQGFLKPITVFKKAAQLAGKGLKRIGTGVILFGIAKVISVIAKTIKDMSELTSPQYMTGLKRTGQLLIAFIGIVAILGTFDIVYTKLSGSGSLLENLAKYALGIGLLILVLSKSIARLASVPEADWRRAATSMVVIVGILTLFELISAGLAEISGNKGGISMGIKTALAMSVLIGTLTLCIGLLSLITEKNLESVLWASGAIGVVLLAMGVWCGMLGKVKFPQALVVMGGLILIINALNKVFIALKDIEDPWYAAKVGLAIVGVISILGLVFSGILDKIENPFKVLGLVAGIAGVIIVLSKCLYNLQAIPWQTMAEHGAVIVAVVGILAFISESLGSMEWQQALFAIGSIAAIAAGIWYIADAFKALSTIDTGDMLWQAFAIGVLAVALAGIGVAIADLNWVGALAVGAILLIAFAIKVLSEAALTFAEAGKLFAEAISVMVDALVVFVEKITPQMIIDYAGALTVFTLALDMFAILGTGPFVIVLYLLGQLANVLKELNPQIEGKGESYREFAYGLQGISRAFGQIASADLGGLVVNMAKIVIAIKELGHISEESVEKISKLSNAVDSIVQFNDAAKDLTDHLDSIINQSSSIDPAITAIVNAFEKLHTEMKTLFENIGTDAINALVRGLQKAVDDTNNMNSIGNYIMTAIGNGIRANIDRVTTTVANDIIDGLEGKLQTYMKRAYDAGFSLTDNLGYGMQSGVGAFCWAARSIYVADSVGSGLVGQIGKWFGKSQKTGEELTKNLGDGMGSFDEETIKGYADDLVGTFLTEGASWEDVFNKMGMGLGESTGEGFAGVFTNIVNGIVDALPPEIKEVVKDKLKISNLLSKYTRQKYASAEDQRRKDMELARKYQSGELTLQHKEKEKSLEEEIANLGKNTGATKSNSKAKKENEKANEKKTEAIDEESEALGEETEAAESNEEEIRALAEEIEVVTKAYDKLLDTRKFVDQYRLVKRQSKILGQFWSQFKTEGWTSAKQVEKAFKKINQSMLTTSKYTKKGVYAFKSASDDYIKKYGKKYTEKHLNNEKAIKKAVEETGRTIAKVYADRAKVYSKSGSGIEKMTIRLTKNVKNLAKYATEAKNFAKAMGDVYIYGEKMGKVEDFVYPLRNIQKYFVNLGSMPGNVKKYLQDIRAQFYDFHESMRILNKAISGDMSIFSGKNEALPYVEDAFISLASSLYDGSEAANEYATEHARLLFLMENGLATAEEVEEHYQSYIQRITDALKEYHNTLQETLSNSLDIWSEFDRKTEDQTKDFLSTIDSQLAGYQQWGEMLMEVSKRGIDFDLLKQLNDSGVQSFGKLKNLLTMTENEFAYFNLRYMESQQTAKMAADMALAALANARTMATARAASASGKLTKAQLKQSKAAAKSLAYNNRAVARYQARYNNMKKRQEKEYLKSLTKEQKDEYKRAKREEQKRIKTLKAKAATEEAKRSEENRIKTILEGIKTFEDYSKVLGQYANDTKTITALSEFCTKAFKGLEDVVSDNTEGILNFADVLDESGEEGLNYFEEMAKRIQKLKDEIVDSVKSVNLLTTAFGSAEKISGEKIMNNMLSQIYGNTQSTKLFQQLATKGYTSYVIKDVIEQWKSDHAAGNALIEELLKGDQEYIDSINAGYEKMYGEDIAKAALNAAAKSNKTLSDYKKATEAAQKVYNDAVAAENSAKAAIENTAYAKEQKQKAIDDKRLGELKNILKKKGKLSKAQEKEYIKLLKKYGGKYKGTAYATLNDAISEQVKLNEYNRAVTNYNNAVQARIDKLHELQKAQEEQAREEERVNELIANNEKKAEVMAWFNNIISSVNNVKNALKSMGASTSEIELLTAKVKSLVNEFKDADLIFRDSDNFKAIKEYADKSEPFGIMADGLYQFGVSITDANTDAQEFFETLKQGLKDYEDQLNSSIKSSSDFFSMFKGFSDEDNPLQATDYLEYAESQKNALIEWQNLLKTVTDKGLDKELVEKFASQGLGSYEQLSAWAKASAAQIGEYNQLWRDYQTQVENATNTAMASIAASWSDAGQVLSESMIKYFNNAGADRLKEAGYEASAMVITGVKDGLTNAMPTIISAVEHTDTSGMSSAIGKSIGTSINTGLVEAISGSVNETVSTAVEKFKMAVDSVLAYANEVLPTDYTITIHVDTSEIDAAVARMNAAIAATNVSAGQTSAAVTSSVTNQNATTEPITTEVTPSAVNLNYVQNNYSPKALDQVEIYRNTQNQLNSTKTLIELQATQ